MTPAVFYILTGKCFIEEARASADSINRHMPYLERVLFTPDDGVEKGRAFDRVVPLPPRQHEQWHLENIRYLGMALKHLPRQVLMLDSDVYACMPFPEIFDLAERFDLTGTHSPGRRTGRVYGSIPICFPEMVTGVNGMHNSGMLQDFVRSWYALHLKHVEVYGNNDQASLREALWMQAEDNNLLNCFQYYLMPPEWNLRLVSRDGYFVRDKVRFLHGRHPDMEGLAQSVNSREGMRVWKPN